MNDFWQDFRQQLQLYYQEMVDLMPRLLMSLLIFVVAILIAGWVRRFAGRRLENRVDDPLLASFLARALRLLVLTIGVLLVLRIVGLSGVAASLMATAGIGAFIIGFAFKDIGENFLAGVLMAFHRPFNVGDVVEIGDLTGRIVGMTLRHTQVKTFDGKDAFIPNGTILKNPIVNQTIDGYLRHDFAVGLDYESDLQQAIRTVLQAMQKVEGVLHREKPPTVIIEDLGTSTVNLRIYYWINTFDSRIPALQIRSATLRQVVVDLMEAGFYLPADIVELKNYGNQQIRTFQAS